MKKSALVITAAISSLFFFAGCSKNPGSLTANDQDYTLVASYEDNSGEDIAKEIARLAESFNYTTKFTLGAAKTALSADIQWQPWSYSSNWWFHSGSLSLSITEGDMTISSTDSVKFMDASGMPIKNPMLAVVADGQIKSHGVLTIDGSAGGYIKIYRDYDISGKVSNQTTLTLNGSLTQKFAAEDASALNKCNFEGTASVSNVTFTKELLGWSKPVSGSAVVTSNFKTITITFKDGTATVKVKAKDGTVVKNVTVNL